MCSPSAVRLEKPSFLDLNGIKDITVKAGKDFEVHIPYKATPKAQAQLLIDEKDFVNDDRMNVKVVPAHVSCTAMPSSVCRRTTMSLRYSIVRPSEATPVSTN